MELFYAPGACSLADHIALHEAGLSFETTKVDLKAKKTADGRDYAAINPKGYVPALDIGGGEVLTENVAILSWIADQKASLTPAGALGRFRLLEALAYITSEIHKSFKPLFSESDEKAKAAAKEAITKRLTYIAERLKTDFLLGDQASVADAYLFVMLLWARKNEIALPKPLAAYAARMAARPAVQKAITDEGLTLPAWA